MKKEMKKSADPFRFNDDLADFQKEAIKIPEEALKEIKREEQEMGAEAENLRAPKRPRGIDD